MFFWRKDGETPFSLPFLGIDQNRRENQSSGFPIHCRRCSTRGGAAPSRRATCRRRSPTSPARWRRSKRTTWCRPGGRPVGTGTQFPGFSCTTPPTTPIHVATAAKERELKVTENELAKRFNGCTIDRPTAVFRCCPPHLVCGEGQVCLPDRSEGHGSHGGRRSDGCPLLEQVFLR